jgi:CRISPR-associated protein Cas1
MTNRIIEIANNPARVKVHLKRLVIEIGDNSPQPIPLEEVAVLVAAHPAVTLTSAALSGLMGAGGVFVCCNAQHLPTGWMLPVVGHHLQTERFEQQVNAGRPVVKRLWRQIVRAKISAQGATLEALHGDDAGLPAMIPRVRSGDPDNVEAQAARRYWGRLFGRDTDFRRQRDGGGPNAMLNYGYTVLRAVTARALCAAGLHPGIGLHHSNRYDPFVLSADMMEPLRPVVDAWVARHAKEHGMNAPFDCDAKRALLENLTGRLEVDGEQRTLFDASARTASSLAQVFAGERADLLLPSFHASTIRV